MSDFRKNRISFSNVANNLRVRMGEWNAAGDTEPLPAQEFLVNKIFIHPNFNPNNLMNDVAVLRLAVPVPLGDYNAIGIVKVWQIINSSLSFTGQLPTITTACLPVSSFVGQR